MIYAVYQSVHQLVRPYVYMTKITTNKYYQTTFSITVGPQTQTWLNNNKCTQLLWILISSSFMWFVATFCSVSPHPCTYTFHALPFTTPHHSLVRSLTAVITQFSNHNHYTHFCHQHHHRAQSHVITHSIHFFPFGCSQIDCACL